MEYLAVLPLPGPANIEKIKLYNVEIVIGLGWNSDVTHRGLIFIPFENEKTEKIK